MALIHADDTIVMATKKKEQEGLQKATKSAIIVEVEVFYKQQKN